MSGSGRVMLGKDGRLRGVIRIKDEYEFYMLDDAIELLPPAKLHKIVRKYLDLRRLDPDSEKPTKASLLADVKAFEKARLAGECYESFKVNSRNFMEKSNGTTGWIAESRRLLDRCVEQAKMADPAEVPQAFDIIFYPDEAGAWQVGVNWEKVLPSRFKVLSATAEPERSMRSGSSAC